jgi:hypothetical protein
VYKKPESLKVERNGTAYSPQVGTPFTPSWWIPKGGWLPERGDSPLTGCSGALFRFLTRLRLADS